MKRHITNITVRGYELDSYQHVNNAVYLNYLEQARWEFCHENNLLDKIGENQLFLVVVEIKIRYQRELKLLDEIAISTIMKSEPPYLLFTQKITHHHSKLTVARAKVKTIFVDQQRIPHDIPSEIAMLIKQDADGKN